MDGASDDDLMAAVQQGDRSAFETLVRRHIDALHAYAFRLSRSTANADDLVQDTFLAVWQKSRTYKAGKVKLTTWLHRVLHNKFVDEARKARPEAPERELASVADAATPAKSLESTRALADADELLRALPENQRAAVMLTHVHGFNNQETAAILGIGVRAVESLLARARRTMRAAMRTIEDESFE